MPNEFDVVVYNHGSVHMVHPLTQEALYWLEENTNGQWLGNRLAVEPRYTYNLLMGMEEAGFNIPRARND
jgi:hypothetical protein